MPEDMERIMRIPLPRCPEPNELLWAYDKQGIYSIKGQFGNTVTFKIIYVSCAVEIISYEENQLSVW